MKIQACKPYFSEHITGAMAYTHILSGVIHPQRDAPLSEQALAQFKDAAGSTKKGISVSMCFAGSSGTGKILLLANLCYACQLPAIFVEKAFFDAVEKSRVSALFTFAEKQKAILFFDEADALLMGNTSYADEDTVDPDFIFKLVQQRQGASIFTISTSEALERCKMRLKYVVETN
ncbi:MAG: hypothetical protein Alis3KO_32560 [Aliiglaciecola sp.]